MLYVLDEPTIGLHPRDNDRLLQALQHLRDLGNTLVLVEHDREVIEAADYLLDFGPGAGDRGGEITARGTPKQVHASRRRRSPGKYLGGEAGDPGADEPPAASRRKRACRKIAADCSIVGAPAAQPARTSTSTSRSARSSPSPASAARARARWSTRCCTTRSPASCTGPSTAGAAHDDIRGLEQIDKVINVDQDPLGNSPSSNPATYTGVFDLIRELFAQLPESKVRGYHPRRFSFNKPGGRCEACEGNGQKKIEMHFLPDVWVECDACHGSRYNPETLAVQYNGKIASPTC